MKDPIRPVMHPEEHVRLITPHVDDSEPAEACEDGDPLLSLHDGHVREVLVAERIDPLGDSEQPREEIS